MRHLVNIKLTANIGYIKIQNNYKKVNSPIAEAFPEMPGVSATAKAILEILQ